MVSNPQNRGIGDCRGNSRSANFVFVYSPAVLPISSRGYGRPNWVLSTTGHSRCHNQKPNEYSKSRALLRLIRTSCGTNLHITTNGIPFFSPHNKPDWRTNYLSCRIESWDYRCRELQSTQNIPLSLGLVSPSPVANIELFYSETSSPRIPEHPGNFKVTTVNHLFRFVSFDISSIRSAITTDRTGNTIFSKFHPHRGLFTMIIKSGAFLLR